MIAHERVSRRRDERGDAREQLEDSMSRVSSRVLDAICDTAVGEQRESVERERLARAVTDQTFAGGVVVGSDGDGGV